MLFPLINTEDNTQEVFTQEPLNKTKSMISSKNKTTHLF